MISANFYQPTTYYNSNQSGQSPDRNTLVSQSVWNATDAQPYFLGWCKLPTAMDVTRFKTEDEGGITRFTAFGSDMDNVSYTYNVNYTTYSEGLGGSFSFLPANNDGTQGRNGHLPNKLQVGTLLTQSYCHIWAVFRTSDTEEITGAWRIREIRNMGVTTQIVDFNFLLGFLKGDTTVQLTVTNPSNTAHTKTFDLTGTDFEETGYYHYNGALDSGYGDIYLFIARFEAFGQRDYTTSFPSDPSTGFADSYTNAWGMIKTPWTLLTAYSSLGYWSSDYLYFDFRNNNMPWFTNVPVVGNIENIYGYGIKFTITSDNPVLVSGSTDLFLDGNVIGFNAGTNYLQIFRMFTPTECLEVMAIQPRYIGGVPHIGEDGAPIIGEFTNDPDEMTPWQLGDITDSEYTDDDRPPYEPEPSGEDEESGTRIPNQFRYFTGANNFISQYAMKATQIQTFGQMLWNSWAESTTFVDAVNNFWIALNIENFTGSFDISSVMNFIVSLKVFPFNITHFDTSIFTLTNTLRIGRGTFPFLFPSEVGNIIKVLSNIVYVDCGLIHDPTTGQYGIPRKFNDFRDYTNVSITCFCPYCGTVELNPGDVVGRQLSCKYAVDLQTGECLCLITVADSTGDLYNVAAISGNMGASIPVSATNSGLIEARRLSDAGNALGLFGGMFTENLSMGSNTFAKAKDSQSSIGAIASASTQAASNLFKDIKQTSNFAANMLSRGAIGCPMMQGGSGFAAFSQADTPYVQIRYGIYSEPANYSHSVGRISTKSGTLSDYKDSGLVICENVDVSGFTCHEDERSEIKALLESGVYL